VSWEDRQLRRIFRKLRRMHYWQKITVMDWLNDWYSDIKEQQRMEAEECE